MMDVQLLESACADLLRDVVASGPVGVDVVHIPTWRRHLDLGGDALIKATYLPAEAEFSAGRAERLASRLAGKEAVLKVLGTGMRGISLRDVEIVTALDGRPSVRLHGPAAVRARELDLAAVEVSLCHEEKYAIAVAAGAMRRTHDD